MNRCTAFVLLIVTSTLLGCSGNDGPQIATVAGRITWEGKPLADAGVAFTPEKGPVAIGTTDEEGRFTLSTQGREGAVLGAHRVTVQAFEAPPPGKKAVSDSGERLIELASRIPIKYGNLRESGLQANVTDNGNDFTFELK